MKRHWHLITFILGFLCVLAFNAWGQTQGTIWRALPDVSVASTAATVIAAQSGSRLALVCTNTDTVNGVRLGDDTVSATRGVRLGPQSTVTFTGTSAMYGWAESGTVTVSCSEEVR